MALENLIAAIRGQSLPAVLVDADAFDRNVRKIDEWLQAAPGRPSLRLATKSLRVPALIRRVLGASPRFRGLMCFSAAEAAHLANQGFDDLLVAYPDLDEGRLAELARLHRQGRRIMIIIDSVEQAAPLDRLARGEGTPFPVVIEADAALRPLHGLLHLGARRSAVRSAAGLETLLMALREFPGVAPAGLMVYESQIAGLTDRNPWARWMNPVHHWVRRISVRRTARRRQDLADTYARVTGRAPDVFNGGGSGSLSYALRETCLTEVTAGSGFLTSHLFDYYSNLALEPALFFAAPAVRRPDPGWVTCLGGGYVSSGKPGWDKVPLPVWPRGARLSPDEGTGEVQTPIRLPAGSEVGLGEPVLFRPAKAGEIAERFPEYLIISQGRIVEHAPTYRGQGQCFF